MINKTIPIDSGVVQLYTAELMECHRLLDTIGICQSGYDEQLSISQRVAETVELVKYLRGHVNARLVIKHIQSLELGEQG